MNFSRFLDIQSWWEVPSIAYFCSLFRTAFNLLDFDIEELEEALLTDGTEDGSEESAGSLLTELIVRLLSGCLGSNDISAFNYQMYLRRLFRRKCQELNRYNPFDSDIDFQFLPLRTKVEILYALCDFRLDADDVFDLFKNLEAESLRVEPLGWDSNNSAYWYFYGTRLYREDIIKKSKGKNKRKKIKENKKRGWFYEDDWLEEEDTDRVWQVVCFTEDDWTHLTEKFSRATSKVEKELYRSLSQNFLPEIPRLFQEKERLQRKRHLELAPRRTSSRVLQKIKQKEEESKQSSAEKAPDDEDSKQSTDRAREIRAKRRNLLRSQSVSSNSLESSQSEEDEMPQKVSKQAKGKEKRSKNSSATHKGEPPPPPPLKTGRKTNNSLACATGQIVIPENDEPVNSTRKKLKTSQIFSQTEEDIQTDMYKVLEQLTAHDDAWPFMDPVEEEYAPNYYAVIRRPMDLRKMEERLDNGYYTDFSMFKADFKLIVNNCRLYNGQDNEYTTMVDNLQAAFDRLTEKYMHRLSSSDEEIAVEYQLPTPSRKHKLKSSESPTRHKRKKHKINSDSDPTPNDEQENIEEDEADSALKKSKEFHKTKTKKKRKGHHRHGKHSKNHHKKGLHKAEHDEKSKHSKKQKHTKNKDKDSKKSKQKKKKSRHLEPEPSETRDRSISQDSYESSNRSRSASPLPSIHTPTPTPTPSPTELYPPEAPESVMDPDFYKDKYDKIKERRRHVSKKEEAWESLFDYKRKIVDKQKQNLHIPEKDKNQKLRETIEKLRAKNEKYKTNSAFNSLFTPSHSSTDKNSDSNNAKDEVDFSDFSDLDEDNDTENKKGKVGRKGFKKNAAKNESASEALEQAVKDISKWLDEAPKGSAGSSPCDSPAQTISTEDHENSRLDDDLSQGEKPIAGRKEHCRKRPSSREPKLIKRREIQRTIDRLQPGKSKGNLLTNISNKNTEKVEETAPPGPLTKVRDTDKGEESPKLSLGSVLPTVEFTLGNDHEFGNKEVTGSDQGKDSKSNSTENANKEEDTTLSKPVERKVETVVQPSKKDAEVETEPPPPTKPSQEKATPNLSAWFKAFGAPKSTGPSTSIKKKPDDQDSDEKIADNPSNEKPPSPKITAKYDSPTDPETPNTDGGDSPLPNVSATPRQRRTSTGSSVSERSSFSQDLDSPRHQMSHTSPLLRSPASPRTDDFQKITYPIINGTVRAGFYQDTTSIKSSPDKSCSPREAPQSPYSPYSQHVYASNSVMGSSTPNYFVDHNKSPLPTYSQNPQTYYDTAKISSGKSGRHQEDFSPVGPESYQQNQFGESFSPTPSPYSQSHSVSYSQPQTSPLNATDPLPHTPVIPDPKTALFPVKKRTYNEPEQAPVSAKKPLDSKDVSAVQSKNDYQKINQTLHMSSMSTPSVDDIALALSEKSEIAKLRDKTNVEISEQHGIENRDSVAFGNSESVHDSKKDITANAGPSKNISINKKENVDMVNMGYMNPDDRRNSGELHDEYLAAKTNNLNAQQKAYDIDAIAINLGMTNQHLSKAIGKAGNIPPAHSHDRTHGEGMTQNIAHAHHAHYEALSNSQTMNKFSLNDIELANKKLYSSSTTSSPAPLDYGNWKMTSQIRKPEISASDYSSVYSANTSDKLKSDMSSSASAINYNKNLQHQFSSYNIPRQSVQNMPSELRIPNPRGLLKNDHINVASSIADTDISKNIEKSQKSDKLVQNHPYVGSIPYKTPYSTHSSLPLDTLRNLPNIPQMLERYTNDERYLSSFAGSSSSLYHDKTFQMAQMFNKSMSSDMHPGASAVSMYNQPSPATSKDSNIYKSSSTTSSQVDTKTKTKRKRTLDTKPNPMTGSQSYSTSCGTDVLPSVKSSMMPGSAFNFGTSTNMALGGGLYADNAGFSLEDFRNSNQLMAANYMAAAVAHQQRNSTDVNAEKMVKPAHQNTSHTSGSFPFIGHGHPQVRAGAGYPFVGADTSSPLYQQYLQRHQEELLRQTGAQIMSLYPPGYPPSLAVRQPYDSINRPSWL